MRLLPYALLSLVACLPLLAGESPSRPGNVRVETGDPLFLCEPGREDRLAIVISNPRPSPVKLRFAGRLSEIDGRPIELAQEVEVPAAGEIRLPVPLGERRTGIRYLDYTLSGDGLKAESGQSTFIYGTPSTVAPDPAGFHYGVASHPADSKNTDQDREREMMACARAGLRIMRMDATWSGLEPKAGEWKFTGLDRLIELSQKHGVEMQLIFSYGVAHAAGPAATAAYEAAKKAGDTKAWLILARSAPEDAAWRNYVSTLTRRYQGKVHLWEVWNEPDLAGFFRGSTDEYIRMLRSAAEEVKRADPANLVLTGGFATVHQHGGRSLNPDLQERVLAEASDAFDIHAYHGHGPFKPFRQSVEGELARMRAKMQVQKPIYFNETALTSTFNGEKAQAWALIKKLAYARSRGSLGYTWYDLRNDGWDLGDGEHNYGMVQRDFHPKAVYAACIELTRRMHGTRYVGELALGAGRYGYVFAGQGRRLLVLWNEEAGLGDEPIALRVAGATSAASVDLMGNATPLPVRGGIVMIRPGTAPTYVELPGGETLPEVAGTFIGVTGEVMAAPGERVPVTVRLTNPLAEALGVRIAWDEAGTPVERLVQLPANGSSDVALVVPCPADATWARPAAMTLRYAVDGGPWSGAITVPVLTVQRIPVTPVEDRPADFTIDAYAAVVNFFEADPAQQHNTWKGPEDLSARIWLARGADALRVRVVAKDDRHHQAEAAVDSWRGDGIQLAFEVSGQKGFWEVGAARGNDGSALRYIWSRPDGMAGDPATVTVATTPAPGAMTYDITLPYATFGLSDQVLERGFRFNLIVNDNDGGLRKGFIRVAPGIGERKDPGVFPFIRFAKP